MNNLLYDRERVPAVLNQLSPAELSYEEWLNVGIILKELGMSPNDWEQWSMADQRFNHGECEKKWKSFNGSGMGFGSLVEIAKRHGLSIKTHQVSDAISFDFNSTINLNADVCDTKIIDVDWVEEKAISLPSNWSGKRDLINFLTAAFNSDDKVCYVTESYLNEKQQKWLPKNAGVSDRTASQLIEELQKEKDITNVIGTWNVEAGGWVRINPVDGKGGKDQNVTDFRHALIECDNVSIEKQNAVYRELELPITTLVFSGGKSLHALVRIDASSITEYKQRVNYLYEVCQRNGLDLDTQNKNPSRLSRLPGITRGDEKQFLVDTAIGKKDWEEWVDWIADLNDDLPDFQNLHDSFKNMPDLAPVLIDGILRQGHKMLLAGPSKAGKSFDLLELAAAISAGTKWHGYNCVKGKILYVNLEIDAASCIHRAKTIFDLLGPNSLDSNNIDFWHLRGRQLSMDKLAPKLIRRAGKRDYIAIIIDPIYKVITGDENSAEQMSKFFNYFDTICRDLGVALIYCHHHSKGEQGGKKSMDRSSGSGVFARDPDAVIDYIELEIDSERKKVIQNVHEVRVFSNILNKKLGANWSEKVSMDDQLVGKKLFEFASKNGLGEEARKARVVITEKVKFISAWRMSGNVREFKPITDKKFFFEYPVHTEDKDDLLADAKAAGEEPVWKKAQKQKANARAERQKAQKEEIDIAYDTINKDPDHKIVTVKLMAEIVGVSDTAIRNRLKKYKEYTYEHGTVYKEGNV